MTASLMRKWIPVKLMIFVFELTQIHGFCSSDFVSDIGYPYRYYQGSTLYDEVRGEINRYNKPDGCVPISMVFVARHGSRHPGAAANEHYDQLVEIQENINSTGTATLCEEDLTKIKEWRNWYNASLDKNLAETGITEMRELGQRFSAAYPELFSNGNMQRFIASNFQRNIMSARVFMGALPAANRSEIEIDSRILRLWEDCENYQKRVAKNERLGKNVRNFLRGKRMGKITDLLASRLGIPRNLMSKTLASTIHWEGCAREKWATGRDSAWCLALSKNDKQAFEYARDMRDYLKMSFGRKVSYRHSCVLKHRILSALKNASTRASGNEPTSHFLFGHKPTILPLLTEMKLIQNDGPFFGRDFKIKLDRRFLVSKLVPGSGNIAFVLYRCVDDEMKLQVFHNEHLLMLPLDHPEQDGLWNLEDALQYFGFYNPNDCNWSEICSISRNRRGRKHDR